MGCIKSGDAAGVSHSGVWTLFLAAVGMFVPRLQPPVFSSLSPIMEMPTCDVKPHDMTMKCGVEVNIFAENTPGDFWTIAALFRQANALNCRAADYPIKAIFGGGGYNADMSLRMMRQFLRELQVVKVVPFDLTRFNIQTQVFPGPTSLYPLVHKFDRYGRAFNDDYRRDNPQWPSQSTLPTTIQSLANVQQVMSRQEVPYIVGLRTIFEYVIPWFEILERFTFTNGSENQRIPTRPEYQQDIQDRGWNRQFFESILYTFKRARSASFSHTQVRLNLNIFYERFILRDDSPLAGGNCGARFQLFMQIGPQMAINVERQSILRSLDGSRVDRSNLFTVDSQAEVYSQLWQPDQPPSRISKLMLGLTADWNEGLTQSLVSIIEKSLDWLIRHQPDEHKAAATTCRSIFESIKAVAKVMSNMEFKTLTPKLRLYKLDLLRLHKANVKDLMDGIYNIGFQNSDAENARRSLYFWSKVAPWQHSWIEVTNLLVPFVLSPNDNLVKQSLLRVRGDVDEITVNGELTWIQAGPESDSNVWITQSAFTGYEAEQRERTLRREIREMYGSVFRSEEAASSSGASSSGAEPGSSSAQGGTKDSSSTIDDKGLR